MSWKDIWEEKGTDIDKLDMEDVESVFLELKRVDGFDLEGGLSYAAFRAQYEDAKSNLGLKSGDSAFEVGCGSGANLFLLSREGISVGGMDYSEKLLQIAQRLLSPKIIECLQDEAKNLPVDVKYDVVFSNSVFAYFENLSYAHTVLEKMWVKSRRSVGVIDVYDESLKEECIRHRRAFIKDYDLKYKDLPKMFFPRIFFEEFADEHNARIMFTPNNLEGYENAPYTYNCFLYKD